MYSYPYSYAQAYSYTPFFSMFLPVLALIVIIAGGLALYFLFVRKPNRFQGTVAKLHDALNFRTFYTERLLRALYSITVVAIIVYSVILLFKNFFGAILLFLLGNLIARIVYEYSLLLLVMCRNTQEINRKMGPLPEEQPAPPASGSHPSSGAPQQPPVTPAAQQPAPQQPTPPQNAAPVPPQAPQQPPVPPQDGQQP